MKFGVHTSIRRGWIPALERAAALGCDTLQIFSKSPHAFRGQTPTSEWGSDPISHPLSDADADAFHRRRLALGLSPLIIHTPFLPNLSTRHERMFARSLRALEDDLSNGVKLRADYLVIHPGAYSPGADAEDGLARMADALRRTLPRFPGPMLLIENMAGGGRRLGATWEELSDLLERVGLPERVGVCLDTAHAWGAGYALDSEEGVLRTLADLDRVLGAGRIQVIHLNDSTAARGSHKDLHQHLGQGRLGEAGIGAMVRHPALSELPAIIEDPPTHLTAHEENLAYARALDRDKRSSPLLRPSRSNAAPQ